MAEAYITGTGAYLPGDPVSNEELAVRFGDGTRRDEALRRRALAANGIRTRHYATDKHGKNTMLNEELAVHAVSRALADRGLPATEVRMLTAGTTQGDLLVPGFASMVHGRLGGGPMELLSSAGVCASSMAALKAAVSAVQLGQHRVAVAVGSELASRSFSGDCPSPDTAFLRWTLSDGAGAVVVEPERRPDGLSFRVDWMHLVSYAHEHEVCMSAALPDGVTVPRLRQDMSALSALVDVGVAEYAALVRAGRIDPGTEHVLCHYSAGHFRDKLMTRLREAGFEPDEGKWFTNLYTAGNTGAASVFVLLDAAKPLLRPGDRVLLVVPESGRFMFAFAQLTCVGQDGNPSQAEFAASPLGRPLAGDPPAAVRAFTELAVVWSEFERELARVPVVRRIEEGSATAGDYHRLLRNLRQQVVDGGRWISLAAASFSAGLFWLRSAAIEHAAAEHRDYQLLEQDYLSAGGDKETIATTPQNIGTAALSAFMFYRAGQPDPVDLLGAMFIIEGLGVRKAGFWADRLRDSAGLRADQLKFLRYHSEGDEEHFAILAAALRSGLLDDAAVSQVVRTARVVARLYALQLEELDHV